MVYRDWNRWNDEGFTFLGSDVSTSWVYLLSQMLFWQLMYLHCLDIHCCRCSFLDQCICNLLFFEPADAFSLPVMYNCICILPFLEFKDTPFANFASTSHIFDNVKMLPSKITHPTCSFNALRIFHIKILHLQSPKIHYRKYLSHNILCVLITSQLEPIHYLQKIDIRNSSEYEMGAGDT